MLPSFFANSLANLSPAMALCAVAKCAEDLSGADEQGRTRGFRFPDDRGLPNMQGEQIPG